ncbi:MAG: Uma2 family endonuclease, partial [Anaerolineae bacterium]|nr:Uma2 family endonuclease [Anaerolineae bacterium]
CIRDRPKTKHQRVSINLAIALATFVRRGNLGEVLTAPIDVRMGEWADPVQPDILFIQQDRLGIIKENWIEGAPDLIVEILSPSSWLDDRRTKYRVYAKAGVREYWLVEPERCQIEIFVLRGSDYALLGHFASGELAYSEILKGFQIQVDEVCR